MTKTTRRSMMGAFAAATVVVVMASVAWACGPNGMTAADPWFCRSGVQRCTYNFRIGTTGVPASASRSYYSMLGGGPTASDVVSANTDFTLRYVTGDHSALTDAACVGGTQNGSAFKKTNGTNATFTTGTTGSWNGQGPVSMPAAGTYTICAVPTGAFPNVAMSDHYYPFVVV